MCDCIKLLNESLAEANTELDIPLAIDFRTGDARPPRMLIATTKVEPKKRGRASRLIANYCPMCGEPYPDGGGPTPRTMDLHRGVTGAKDLPTSGRW